MDKITLRQTMKQKRLSIEKDVLSCKSHKIWQQILNHPQYHKAKIIGCYVSMNDEVETHGLIKNMLINHRVCVPKIIQQKMHFYEITSLDDLKEGHFHVLEPITQKRIDPLDIDLMLVPMLAFDQYKHRVGYGKGYYDRYFSQGYRGYKMGLAFSCQYVAKINVQEHDCCLDEIITEE